MSTHNIGFYEDLTKIIFELSSNIIKYARNTHLIISSPVQSTGRAIVVTLASALVLALTLLLALPLALPFPSRYF